MARDGKNSRDDWFGSIIVTLCVVGSLAACAAWLKDEIVTERGWSAAKLERSDADRAL